MKTPRSKAPLRTSGSGGGQSFVDLLQLVVAEGILYWVPSADAARFATTVGGRVVGGRGDWEDAVRESAVS